jgi:hypothetical protein
MPGTDFEFALALAKYLKRQGWPVNEITEVLLVGRHDDNYSFQLVAAYPATGSMVDEYVVELAYALQRAVDASGA